MFRLSFIFILLFCFLPLDAAKRAERIPDWVTSPSKVYSEAEYLMEIGTGSNQKEADNKAIEGLAAIFNRSVSSKTDSSLKYREKSTNVEKIKEVDQRILISTNVKNLVGVEIKERWKSNSGIFYALALLNKNKAISIYSERYSCCASSITEVLSVPDNEKGTFREYFRYLTACRKAYEMSLYDAYLSLLNPAYNMIYEKNYNLDKLKIKASAIAKNILITVNLEGEDCDERLKPLFEQIFTSKGFSIAKGNNARYALNVMLEKGEETVLSENRIMVRYSLTSELVDKIMSEALFPFVINDKAVQFSSEAVNNQIFKNIKKKIEKNFGSLLDQLIAGLPLE